MRSSIFWVPGPGKAAESFPQPQAVQKVGHQLGCGEGIGGGVGGWAEFSSQSPLSFSFPRQQPLSFPTPVSLLLLDQSAHLAIPSLASCAASDSKPFRQWQINGQNQENRGHLGLRQPWLEPFLPGGRCWLSFWALRGRDLGECWPGCVCVAGGNWRGRVQECVCTRARACSNKDSELYLAWKVLEI